MEVIVRKLKCGRSSKFKLIPIGDSHLGAVHCDEDLLINQVKEIKEDPEAIWLGMGDYGDFVTPSDFKRWDGRILADWMRGHEDNIANTQIDRIDDIFSPIWDKCIGLIEGNHEEAIRRYHHVNIIEELLKRANKKATVPYAGVQCFIRLNFKRGLQGAKDIIIHARHGTGSARTSGARALAVLRMSQSSINAQITLMGHLHGQESPDIPQRLLLRNDKIKSYESLAVMTGAWIKAYMQGVPPCYLERWDSTPSVLGCPKIIIEPYHDRFELIKSRRIQNV